MAGSNRNVGRPRAAIATTLMTSLASQPSTVRAVAEQHQISVRAATWTADRLARNGLIRAVGTEPTGRRPANIYASEPAATDPASTRKR